MLDSSKWVTGALDTKTSEEIMALFAKLNDEGITVIIVTHEPDIAEYATRTMAFRDGLVVSDRSVARRRDAVDELTKLPVDDEEEEA